MKRADKEKVFNVHNDANLEAAAATYVQVALERNLPESQMKDIIVTVWK